MDNCSRDYVYFENSQGKRAVLSSPDNQNYWELRGRSGFTAPDVDIYTEKFASGNTKYFGKTLQPRICSMNMVCVGKTTAERDRVFFDMLDVLLDVEGTGEGRLYVRKSDGGMVYLNCVYSGGMNIIEQYRRINLFTLNFYAADPIFYSPEVRFAFSGTDGTITIPNYTQIKLWPEFYFEDKPSALLETGNPIITNNATDKSIEFVKDVVEDGNLVTYEDVNIITTPQKRGVFAYKSKYPFTSKKYAFCLEMFVNSDLNMLDFPLIPGENEIVYSNIYGYNSGYIAYKVPHYGV